MSDLSGACAVEWGEAETAESDVWQWGCEGSNGAGWASRRGLRLVGGASCFGFSQESRFQWIWANINCIETNPGFF